MTTATNSLSYDDDFDSQVYEVSFGGFRALLDSSKAKAFRVMSAGNLLHQFPTLAEAVQFCRARATAPGPRCVIEFA